MSNFILELEPLPGTSIRNAVEEARQKARMLDLAGVRFKFNDKTIFVTKRCDVNELVDKYMEGKNEL